MREADCLQTALPHAACRMSRFHAETHAVSGANFHPITSKRATAGQRTSVSERASSARHRTVSLGLLLEVGR